MIKYLAARGTQRIVGRVMFENHAMRELAQAVGFVDEPDPAAGEEDVRLVLRLRRQRT
jgi:RimJ/RimL family protein N-acetyltransferase